MYLKLSGRADIRASESGASRGLYIDGELHRPLNDLEDHMAKRIQGLEAENERLRHCIALSLTPAQQLFEEMERTSQPGYMWPRLAAEQVVETLTLAQDKETP